MITDYTEIDLEDVSAFLEDLKASGTTNMVSASPRIRQEFECSSAVARKLLLIWSKYKENAM